MANVGQHSHALKLALRSRPKRGEDGGEEEGGKVLGDAGWDCLGTLTLPEILKTQNRLQVEFCAYLGVTRSLQEVGCVTNELLSHTVPLEGGEKGGSRGEEGERGGSAGEEEGGKVLTDSRHVNGTLASRLSCVPQQQCRCLTMRRESAAHSHRATQSKPACRECKGRRSVRTMRAFCVPRI